MNLSDVSSGPNWIPWAIFALILILSIVLISGHGSFLISGYNTASKEEKEKYDEKKLCRVTGIGLAVIAFLILIMGLFDHVLPSGFAVVFAVLFILDIVAMIIAQNTCCKK